MTDNTRPLRQSLAEDEEVEFDTMPIAVKELIARAKERGYVSLDEVNAALPCGQVSSELIEDTLAALIDLGIDVVESEESQGGDTVLATKIPSDDMDEEGLGDFEDGEDEYADDIEVVVEGNPTISRGLTRLVSIGAEVRKEMAEYDALPPDPTITKREAAFRRLVAMGEAYRQRGVFIDFDFSRLNEIEEDKQ